MARSELDDRLAVLLGGRVAEELVYGEISTGAQKDLERGSELVRLMVMKYGMSERVGLATFGERLPMFLKNNGMPWSGEREYSEETARAIDAEVREILDRTHDRVRGILTAKKAVLVAGGGGRERGENPQEGPPPRVLGGGGLWTDAGRSDGSEGA